MTAKLSNSLGLFSGLNTSDDPVRIGPVRHLTPDGWKSIHPLAVAMNVEIDNTFALSSRKGYTSQVSGTNIHSVWTNKSGTLCFFVDDTILYQLHPDFSITTILNLALVNPMVFEEFNQRVYYTNKLVIGYIEDSVSHSLPTPSQDFKLPLPAGQCIAVYKSKLLVARDNVLFIGDALSDCYDIRTGYRVFEHDITAIQPVDKGFYVSDRKTWFISGVNPKEFVRSQADAEMIIPNTNLQVDGQYITEDGVDGQVALWTSPEGICLGDNSGNVKNITLRKYAMPDVLQGTAMIRRTNGIIHYIVSLRR